jgi:hypothetical protein
MTRTQAVDKFFFEKQRVKHGVGISEESKAVLASGLNEATWFLKRVRTSWHESSRRVSFSMEAGFPLKYCRDGDTLLNIIMWSNLESSHPQSVGSCGR